MNNLYDAGAQLNRIAVALEEILRLVKQDMEDSKKRWSPNLIAKLYQLVKGIAQILISSVTFFNFFS